MSQPSKQEVELLKEFRERLGTLLKTEEHKSEAFLLRWLRARDLNLNMAESMLRDSFKWREENDVDDVLIKTFEFWFTKNYPFWIEGEDSKGHPVMYVPMGSWDMRKAIAKGQEEENELVCYMNLVFETALQAMREINLRRKVEDYPISQAIVIVDWKNYSYSQLIHWKALQKLLKMAGTYEAHYPEIIFRCFFINCPSIFPLLMTMLRPILVPNTLAKITCHSNRGEWEPIIREIVPADQLPACIGGTYPSKYINGTLATPN